MALTANKLGPLSHVSLSMKHLTTASCFLHDARDRGVVLSSLEPRRAALQKRLFYKIFLRTDYFVLKFAIKVNFVKIVD
jgi:hypothetical protein